MKFKVEYSKYISRNSSWNFFRRAIWVSFKNTPGIPPGHPLETYPEINSLNLSKIFSRIPLRIPTRTFPGILADVCFWDSSCKSWSILCMCNTENASWRMSTTNGCKISSSNSGEWPSGVPKQNLEDYLVEFLGEFWGNCWRNSWKKLNFREMHGVIIVGATKSFPSRILAGIPTITLKVFREEFLKEFI